MKAIKPCPQCGSPAEVFSTGTIECYGWAWQHYGIRCTDENDKHCGMDLALNADFWYTDVNDDQLIDIWNAIVK